MDDLEPRPSGALAFKHAGGKEFKVIGSGPVVEPSGLERVAQKGRRKVKQENAGMMLNGKPSVGHGYEDIARDSHCVAEEAVPRSGVSDMLQHRIRIGNVERPVRERQRMPRHYPHITNIRIGRPDLCAVAQRRAGDLVRVRIELLKEVGVLVVHGRAANVQNARAGLRQKFPAKKRVQPAAGDPKKEAR